VGWELGQTQSGAYSGALGYVSNGGHLPQQPSTSIHTASAAPPQQPPQPVHLDAAGAAGVAMGTYDVAPTEDTGTHALWMQDGAYEDEDDPATPPPAYEEAVPAYLVALSGEEYPGADVVVQGALTTTAPSETADSSIYSQPAQPALHAQPVQAWLDAGSSMCSHEHNAGGSIYSHEQGAGDSMYHEQNVGVSIYSNEMGAGSIYSQPDAIYSQPAQPSLYAQHTAAEYVADTHTVGSIYQQDAGGSIYSHQQTAEGSIYSNEQDAGVYSHEMVKGSIYSQPNAENLRNHEATAGESVYNQHVELASAGYLHPGDAEVAGASASPGPGAAPTFARADGGAVAHMSTPASTDPVSGQDAYVVQQQEQQQEQHHVEQHAHAAGAAHTAGAMAAAQNFAVGAAAAAADEEQERRVREHQAERGPEGDREAAMQRLGDGAGVLPQVMEFITQSLDAELNALGAEASALTQHQCRVRQGREAIMSRLRQAMREVCAVECAQAAAQEREDYEAAEDLLVRAATLAGEVSKLELASTQLTRELESLSDKRMLLHARQAGIWARAAEMMETELLKRRADNAKHAEALLAQETRVEEALAQRLDEVAHQLQHLCFDKEKVAQERELLQDALDARTWVERAEMDKLEAARATVREEIKELMLLLKIKKDEEASLSQQLAAAGQRVLEVRQSFAPKLGKLEELAAQIAQREAEYASRQAAVTAAQEDLRQERARTQQQQAVVSAAIDQAEQTVSATRARAKQTSQQVKELEENAARRRELVQEEEAARAAIAQVSSLLGEVRSAREKTAEQMLLVQQQVSRSRSELASLEAQVPELEEHKKLAVISKNFKEAARLSHAIKTVISQRDQHTHALHAQNVTLLQLSAALAQHEEEQQLQSARLVEQEGKAAQQRLKCLRWWCLSLSRFGEQAHINSQEYALVTLYSK
jgi:hypothetical protein